MNFIKPKHLSEATVQAEIYSRCKESNIECYLEYRYENCRFDIIIVSNEKILGIIEVKRAHHINTKKQLKKQKEKYSISGLPIHICFCLGDIPHTMTVINNWLEKQANISNYLIQTG